MIQRYIGSVTIDETGTYYVVVEPAFSSDPQVQTRPPPGLVLSARESRR